MRDLRTQLSLAFNLVWEMALSVESEPDANFDRSWNIWLYYVNVGFHIELSSMMILLDPYNPTF